MSNIVGTLKELLLTGVAFINDLYQPVFPEYPGIGIWVLVLCLLIFLFHQGKEENGYALRATVGVFVGLSLVLFMIHLFQGLMVTGD